MRDLQLHFPVSGRRADPLLRREGSVDHQLAFRLQMFPAPTQTRDLRLRGEVVQKRVERNEDQRESPRHFELRHVSLVQGWIEVKRRRLRAQPVQHPRKQIHAHDVHARLQARQQDASRSTRDIKHRSRRSFRQIDVELTSQRYLTQKQIVQLPIIERSAFNGRRIIPLSHGDQRLPAFAEVVKLNFAPEAWLDQQKCPLVSPVARSKIQRGWALMFNAISARMCASHGGIGGAVYPGRRAEFSHHALERRARSAR